MRLNLNRDIFDNVTPPRVFLATQSGTKIGELPAYEISMTAKWNSYSELTFTIDRMYVDVLTGETKVHPLFDKTEGLRQIILDNMAAFVIQDPDSNYSDKDSKTLSCFDISYNLSHKYLDNFYVNNGEVDSIEVTYYASLHGGDTNIDFTYKPAFGEFDSHKRYYIQEYTDTDSYKYVQIQIRDADDYATHFDGGANASEPLYVTDYENVKFYDNVVPELSLLHNIFKHIPDWEIGNVDVNLRELNRKLEHERISVYDLLVNEVADVFKCTVEFDTLTRRVHFREEPEDGLTEDDTVPSDFDTDIYISRENLASELNVKYSSDNIKTKLKVSGGEGLDIREVNLDRNYIMNLDYYHNSDWMEQDLLEAYDDYIEAVETYTPIHTEWVQKWIQAYNKYSDIMNAIPAEGNVVLVGDQFQKLYCVHTPINTAYYNGTINSNTQNIPTASLFLDEEFTQQIPQPNSMDSYMVQGYWLVYDKTNQWFNVDHMYDIKMSALVKMLNMYHIDDDTEANKTDNILLRVKNSASDIATIRIYDKRAKASEYQTGYNYYSKDTNGKYADITDNITNQTELNEKIVEFGGEVYTNNYRIQSIVVKAQNGISEEPDEYSMTEWLTGTLTASKMDLEGYTVSYIGTMGAYLVLAKDEKQEENLQDYGVNLLKEKHDTYTTIFQTQTEAMFSQEKYQCIVQDDQPEGDYVAGTRWLETDVNPAVLREVVINTNGTRSWVAIDGTVLPEDKKNYENYQRYIDNYEKMIAVQHVLIQKEKEAGYWLNGYAVDMVIQPQDSYQSDDIFHLAADKHFRTADDPSSAVIINGGTLTTDLTPVYTFTTPKAEGTFCVYLQGSTPYVSYANSQGVCQQKRDKIRQLTELEEFFSEDQWIRLSPLIREDEYTNDNFFFTGYESKEDEMQIYNELVEYAVKELKTLSQPSLEFSMTMANILALPEFKPLIDSGQFELGRFIRVELRPGLVKRSRLLEVQINFSDLSDFSCTFGNLVTTQNQIDLHAELMRQAVQAGKTVAASKDEWQKAVDKSNTIEQAIASGLADANLQVGRSSGQSIVWNDGGILCRRFRDGTTPEQEQYDDEQIRITSNKILYSNDGFRSAKSAFGSFKYKDKTYYGLLAEAVIGGYIESAHFEGGSLSIGGSQGKFIVNEDGSVQILGPDNSEIYADKTSVDVLNEARKFHTTIEYNGSTLFSEPGSECELTAKVFAWDDDITDEIISAGAKFSWIRNSRGNDATWNSTHANLSSNTITITNEDIDNNAQFSVKVVFDDENL